MLTTSTTSQTVTSLTAPWERTAGAKIPSQVEPLTSDQTKLAMQSNIISAITDSFPRVDRTYADPVYNNQIYCLHSFVPTQGATPDAQGVYGFIKCRGCFSSVEEANQRAEYLIQNCDSYHEIHTGYVGRPFPVARDTAKYVKETKEVDVRKKAMDTISDDVKSKRDQEKKEIEEIKERERKLLDQSNEVQKGTFKEDPLDEYTTLQVKKANLVFTYVETQKKLLDMQNHIKNVYKEIRLKDIENPSLKDLYYEKYMAARRAAHIPDEVSEDNWMKFLCQDAPLDFEY
jgi:hypothetical protein